MRDLFETAAEKSNDRDPLPDRMRPVSLSEIVGQDHILGKDKLLCRLIESDRIPSLILWGPPGSGKTTIAKLVAKKTHARFESLSAVLSGVADLRKVLAEAKRLRGERGEHTILFVDEIHRWSKSQQDALLEAVERGVVTLIGATTENPSFELNAALLSRTRVFVLEPIGEEDLIGVLERALSDRERGLGKEPLEVTVDALSVIARGAWGDARRALSVLELAAENALSSTKSRPAPLTEEHAEEALQHRTLLYDKAGDEHYGVISAFIKSMRGSDPDAAAYYLVRMLESGEDPRFLLRRMVIFASEDIGNADPQALGVAVNALQAFELVGLRAASRLSRKTCPILSAPASTASAASASASPRPKAARLLSSTIRWEYSTPDAQNVDLCV